MLPGDVEDYGRAVNVAIWAMFGLAFVVVGLRIVARAHYSRAYGGGMGLDDYLSLVCLFVFLISNVAQSVGISYGMGRHAATLSAPDRRRALEWNVITQAIHIWQFSLAKFVVVATLGRILSYGTKTTILLWGLAISSQSCILATSVWWFRQCTPVAFGWDKDLAGGFCAPERVLTDLAYFTSAYSVFLDALFALYPAPFIMRLQMPLRTRVAAAAAMGGCALAAAPAIYKLVIFEHVFTDFKTDPTFPMPYLFIVAIAEGTVNLVCASIPALGPMVRTWRHRADSGRRRHPRTNTHSSFPKTTGSKQMSLSLARNDAWDRLDDASPDDDTNDGDGRNGIPLVERWDGEAGRIQKTVKVSVLSDTSGPGGDVEVPV